MALAPLLPQIITAAATLSGVVLTLVFTGRREDRRTKQTLAFEREKLVLAGLRDACVRYQNQVDEMLPMYWDRQRGRDISDDDVDDAWKVLSKVGVEVALAVPIMRVPISTFEARVRDLNGLLSRHWITRNLVPEDEFEEAFDLIETEREFLFECMTVALGTYDVGKETVTERELKKLYDDRRSKDGGESQSKRANSLDQPSPTSLSS